MNKYLTKKIYSKILLTIVKLIPSINQLSYQKHSISIIINLILNLSSIIKLIKYLFITNLINILSGSLNQAKIPTEVKESLFLKENLIL